MDTEGNITTTLTFRSIPDVSLFCKVSTKTVQRAMRAEGIVTAVQAKHPGLTLEQRT
jgi:hypothetical protein